ncbi:MAG: AAA family ATPase [Clostridiales bacterium]|nr:AAA family ATPase [Clostridiales bacterium]
MYLNSKKPFDLFKSEASSYYYVDKSLMLDELWFGKKYICVARPRRFGKSVAAAMIASYFSKGVNANALFSKLKISQTSSYSENLNKFNVIYISLNELPFPCETYSDYISNIRDSLLEELHKAYPDAKSLTADPIELLAQLNELKGETFVFVLDEWDYVFEAMFMTDQDKRNYMAFLRELLVGPYASLVYMTGVIPISKHSSSSELAMFSEFTMESPKFSKHFGFSESEVTDLHTRYLSATPKGERHVTRKGLRQWYKGYWTPGNNMIYNPQTVVEALMVNQLGSYWINTGPYNEAFSLVKSNIAEMRRDLALLVSHEGVPLDFAQCIAKLPASVYVGFVWLYKNLPLKYAVHIALSVFF